MVSRLFALESKCSELEICEVKVVEKGSENRAENLVQDEAYELGLARCCSCGVADAMTKLVDMGVGIASRTRQEWYSFLFCVCMVSLFIFFTVQHWRRW